MNRFAALALVAAALVAATPAVARDVVASPNDAEAFSAVLMASKNAWIVRHLHAVPSVGVVRLNGGQPAIGRDDEVGDIQMSAYKNGGVMELRAALASNPVTRHALEANGVEIGDVLGVLVGSTGSLRVYTN